MFFSVMAGGAALVGGDGKGRAIPATGMIEEVKVLPDAGEKVPSRPVDEGVVGVEDDEGNHIDLHASYIE